MARTVLAVGEKLALLLEYGQSRGVSTKYRAIAEAIGENANNVRKIHLGQNANPGLKILTGLVGYFGIDLAFSTAAPRQTARHIWHTPRPRGRRLPSTSGRGACPRAVSR